MKNWVISHFKTLTPDFLRFSCVLLTFSFLLVPFFLLINSLTHFFFLFFAQKLFKKGKFDLQSLAKKREKGFWVCACRGADDDDCDGYLLRMGQFGEIEKRHEQEIHSSKCDDTLKKVLQFWQLYSESNFTAQRFFSFPFSRLQFAHFSTLMLNIAKEVWAVKNREWRWNKK